MPWMMPYRSTRYSILPRLISSMARPTSCVTVPLLGLGISPRGPSTGPSWPTALIWSGVASHVEVHEVLILDARREVVRTDDVGPSLLGLPGLLALGEDRNPTCLACAVRQHQRAPHHLVGAPRVHVQVDVGLDTFVEFRAVQALQ